MPARIVPHTHWDRAWYWPVERFRPRLVECLLAALRNLDRHPDYHFTCDGQTAILEDFLAVCPHERARVERHARAGRLHLGPMFVLSDLYCTGGEALIRNLLLGMDHAAALGGLQRTLHMPDTFGITPSLPMIAQGFGLAALTFMRGVPGELPGLTDMARGGAQAGIPTLPEGTRLFRWRAADGSEIRVLRLRDGYANAANGIGFDREKGGITVRAYANAVRAALEKQTRDGQGAPWLLLAGVDHQIPWDDLPAAIAEANRAPGEQLLFAGLDAAAEDLLARDPADLPVFEGEFHGHGAASVLGGTISARAYLKLANAAAESAMLHGAEPALAAAALLGTRDESEHTLAHGWKLLLLNHPHDDICGCSVDRVHETNEELFRQATESARAAERRAFARLFQHYGANMPGDTRPVFALFNPQAHPSHAAIRYELDFEGQRAWGDLEMPDAYALVDDEGREVPFRELGRRQSTAHPRNVLELEIHAPLAPARFTRLHLVPRPSGPARECGKSPALENEHLQAEFAPDGTLALTGKASGRKWEGLGLFSEQTDIGDSYDFADIPGEIERAIPPGGTVSAMPAGGGLRVCRLATTLRLPAGWDAETRTRRTETVAVPVVADFVLAPGARHLDVTIEVRNAARDYRLRWNLPFANAPAESLAGLKFHTVRRPAGEPPPGAEAPRVHPEHPADAFVAANGLALFGGHPFNYELVPARDGTPARLAVTLLRAVGYLCHPAPLTTRPGNHAGPHTATPGAQCLGRTLRFRFALMPALDADPARLFRDAMRWRSSPAAGLIDPTAGAYPERTPDHPKAASFYRLEGAPDAVVSAFKPAFDRSGAVILRFHHPSPTDAEARLVLAGDLDVRPFLTSLEERLGAGQEPLPRGPDGAFRLRLPAWGLTTVRLESAHNP